MWVVFNMMSSLLSVGVLPLGPLGMVSQKYQFMAMHHAESICD